MVYSDALGSDQDDIPNEDSQLPEFDETNLFSLNRFPGLDRLETGLRANLGVSYTRYDPAGWSLGLTLGRVLRAEPDRRVRRGHRPRRPLVGLCRRGVARLRLGPRPGQPARSSTPASTSAATSSRWPTTATAARCAQPTSTSPRTTATPSSGRSPRPTSSRSTPATGCRPNWELRGLWRYDVATNSNLRAGAGITYGNECAEFDLSVSRRYTSSNNVPPSTSIGFSVRLAGIGDERRAGVAGAGLHGARDLTAAKEDDAERCESFWRSLCALALAGPAAAANPYAPAITVNDGVITHYDIDQRDQAARGARRQRRPAGARGRSS